MLSLGLLVACGRPKQMPVIGASSLEQQGYPKWFNEAYGQIAGNFVNSVSSSDSLSCMIKFTVIRSGEIKAIELIESSGNEAFDAACLRAIERSSPLPPFPGELQDEEKIAITVPFTNR